MLKLSNLKPRTYEARLVDTQGQPILFDDDGQPVESVRLGTLSWVEWHEVGLAEEKPQPPMRKKMVNGKPKSIEDPDDQEYKLDMVAYNDRMLMRRLAIAMSKEGSTFHDEMAALSDEARLDLLMKADKGILNALGSAMLLNANGNRAQLSVQEQAEAAADRFQPVSEDASSGTDAESGADIADLATAN